MTCKNLGFVFIPRLDNAVIARKVPSLDKCSINLRRALQEFKMIRSEFLLNTFWVFISSVQTFIFFVLSFVLVLSSVLFHCVSSTKVNETNPLRLTSRITAATWSVSQAHNVIQVTAAMSQSYSAVEV